MLNVAWRVQHVVRRFLGAVLVSASPVALPLPAGGKVQLGDDDRVFAEEELTERCQFISGLQLTASCDEADAVSREIGYILAIFVDCGGEVGSGAPIA